MGIVAARARNRAARVKADDEKRRRRLERQAGRLFDSLEKDLLKSTKSVLEKIVSDVGDERNIHTLDLQVDWDLTQITKVLTRTRETAYVNGWWSTYSYIRNVAANHTGGRRMTLKLADTVDEDYRTALRAFLSGGPVEQWAHVIPPELKLYFAEYSRQAVSKYATDLRRDAQKVLLEAVNTGGTLNEKIKALRVGVEEFRGTPEWKLERVVRTETTRSYNIGALQSSVKVSRDGTGMLVGLEYSAILDSRTSAICKTRNHLRMQIDDPGIAANTPPLHPNCRSVWVPLFEWDVPDGWATDAAWANVPEARQREQDVELVRAALGWSENAPEPEKIPVPTVSIPTADAWKTKLRAEIPKTLVSDIDAINLGDIAYDSLFSLVEKSNPVFLPDALLTELSQFRDFGGDVKFVTGGDWLAEEFTRLGARRIPTDWIDRMNKYGGIQAIMAPQTQGLNRGQMERKLGHFVLTVDTNGAETAVHEFGHGLEWLYGSKSIEKMFYDRRTAGNALESIKALTGVSAYKDTEMTRKDAFVSPYMGKDYGGSAYEIYSMGLQYLYYNRQNFWRADPEYVRFMIGILLGVR